jgi:hypothetical protein
MSRFGMTEKRRRRVHWMQDACLEMTHMVRVSFVILALALSGCASTVAETADAGGRDCFRSSQVRGYNVIDDRHVEIRVGANDRYVLETGWNARDLDWDNRIGLRSATGSICTGNGLGVDIIGGEPRRRYTVVSIARAPEPAQAAG